MIEVRRPDILWVDKRSKELKIIDVAVSGDSRVKEKKVEEIEKYLILREEIRIVWQMNYATVIPVVVGTLGVISDKFERIMEKLDLKSSWKSFRK